MIQEVRVPAAVHACIAEAARAAYPGECCGLLVGTSHRVAEAWPAANLSSDPHRYLVDPADHFAALRHARARGLDVIGAYHSHPDHAPRPSDTDLAEAFGSFLYLIAGVRRGEVDEMRAWQLVGGNFVELPLVIESEETLP